MRKGFLDLRRLRYFEAIVRLGSLSAAARDLNVAQPALSHHTAEIDRDLGAAVLVRHQSCVRPTELGERLATHATEILARVRLAEDDLLALAGHGDLPEKTIHLAIIPAADGRALVRAIRVTGALEPIFVEDIGEMPQQIMNVARDGDVVLTMGAGSIGGVPGKLAHGPV